ncbi:MAG: hypothetical protein U0703_22580 [Anaerolineae bacterium]
MNAPVIGDQLIIPVDREHGAIRLVVVVVFLAAWVISGSISALMSAEGPRLAADPGWFCCRLRYHRAGRSVS